MTMTLTFNQYTSTYTYLDPHCRQSEDLMRDQSVVRELTSELGAKFTDFRKDIVSLSSGVVDLVEDIYSLMWPAEIDLVDIYAIDLAERAPLQLVPAASVDSEETDCVVLEFPNLLDPAVETVAYQAA